VSADYWSAIRQVSTRLGAMILETRLDHDYSQTDLVTALDPNGDIVGWNVPYLSRIESGQLVPTNRIAQVLSIWLDANDRDLQGAQSPVARASDPDTSHHAARSVTTETMRGLHRWWLLHLDMLSTKDFDQLNINGDPVGYHATDEGARRFYYGPKVSDSGFRTRRAELRDAGFVVDSGRRYPISTGRNAVAWMITDQGRQALA
jgi:hypothetical protein